MVWFRDKEEKGTRKNGHPLKGPCQEEKLILHKKKLFS